MVKWSTRQALPALTVFLMKGAYRSKTVKAGSASFNRLTTVGAFHKPGASSSINEVVTTVSNYVKTVLTSKFNEAYPEKLAQFNRELESMAAQR